MSKKLDEAGKWVSGEEFANRTRSTATNPVVKQVGQQAAAGVAGHAAGAVAKKLGSKVVPGVGTGLSAYDAWSRWQEGDRSGAVIAALAAAGWLIPGPAGWAIGGGLDAYNLYRDFNADDTAEEPEAAPAAPAAPGPSKRTISGPVTRAATAPKTLSPFQQAFASARQSGQDTFVYNGKTYNTKMAENTSQHPDISSNQRTTRILRQLRAQNPEAKNDLEALLYDYRKSQRQDRVDIARLDQEIDIEDEEIAALQRALDQLRRSRGLSEAAALSEGRMKEIFMQYQDYKHLPEMAFLSRYKISKRDWWNKYRRLIQGSGLGIGMDEAFKHPKKTAQEKLHQQHQELRKKSGLPDPQHYKDLGEKLKKEIEQLKKEIGTNEALLAGSGSMEEGLLPGEYHHYEDEVDPKTGEKKRVYKGVRGEPYDPKHSWGHSWPDDSQARAQRSYDKRLKEFDTSNLAGAGSPEGDDDRSLKLKLEFKRMIEPWMYWAADQDDESDDEDSYYHNMVGRIVHGYPVLRGWIANNFKIPTGAHPSVYVNIKSAMAKCHNELLDTFGDIDDSYFRQDLEEEKKGLYYYVNKRKKAGTSRPKGHPKAPSAQDWKDAAKTAKNESSLQEYGDTKKGQKRLAKVHRRAADRVTSKQADRDPAHARKAQQTQNRAWERLSVKEQGVAEGSLVDKQVAYWDSVAKDKKNKERETLKAKKERHEQTPAGKAEKYWSKKGVAEEDAYANYAMSRAKGDMLQKEINPDSPQQNVYVSPGYNKVVSDLTTNLDYKNPDFAKKRAVIGPSQQTKTNSQLAAQLESGPFSYGAKKPRKGSVADLAAKKRKEQERSRPPIEPRDQMVGVARVLPKDVVENAKVIKTRNYDHWSNKIEQLGATVYPQKNRNHLVAQSWDGETIGEYDVKTDQGWFMTTGVEGIDEGKTRLDPKCWTGYKKQGTKMKGGVRVNNCVPIKNKGSDE